MKRLRQLAALLCFAVLLAPACAQTAPWQLQYDTAANQWVEALPIGNGRLGAMVFGQVEEERIQFNEANVWTGGPRSYVHAGASDNLPEIRQRLLDGKQKEAERLAADTFMSVPLRQEWYQPLGDLRIRMQHSGEPTDYRRLLNLNQAVAVTRYTVDGTRYTRSHFASHPDQAIVVHLQCSQPNALTFTVAIDSPHSAASTSKHDDQSLQLTGNVADRIHRDQSISPGKVNFAARLQVLNTDGQVSIEQIDSQPTLRIHQASVATLVLTAATNVQDFRSVSANPGERLDQTAKQLADAPYSKLLARHQADHDRLFRRVELELGDHDKHCQTCNGPTDQRLLDAKQTADPDLAALVFHYGRYLLIASSRPGGQPANLQGLWNQDLEPAWGSKYTTNINAEMNYWPAEPCQLAECHTPLLEALDEIAESGRETARTHYNAPGWVLHHNFDRWRGTAPINASNHGIWPSGGAWLCHHLWSHYQHSGDLEFLRNKAYPLMKGAAEFFCHTLVPDPRTPEGWLISGPSNSPEQGGLVMGPTMDHQIIRSLLDITHQAAKLLEVDSEFRQLLVQKRDRIAPHQIGKHGQLQEWLEDKDDPNNRHRHVSHLWGVHPGNLIRPDTPELFEAAKVSLHLRGYGGTGWSRAWKINMWARLREADRAYRVLDGLLTLTGSPKTKNQDGGLYPNLFDAHPPFQIDGNFGATSGIIEMLMQAHRTTDSGARLIELLPALPKAWPSGRVRGLKTPDGFLVDLTWQQGQLTTCKIQASLPRQAELRYKDRSMSINLQAGGSIELASNLAPLDN